MESNESTLDTLLGVIFEAKKNIINRMMMQLIGTHHQAAQEKLMMKMKKKVY